VLSLLKAQVLGVATNPNWRGRVMRRFWVEYGLAARVACVGVLLAATFLMTTARASATTLCLKQSANGEIKGPTTAGGSTCNVGFEKIEVPPAAELAMLNKLLPHIKYEEKGVGDKPTIQVTGANLQIVSGEGKTNGPVNGAGNLIIGYDDEAECSEILNCNGPPASHAGSHNLVLGTSQSYTSWGAILGGVGNTASARNDFVVGVSNIASGIGSSISGGFHGTASGTGASVSGGGGNIASGARSSATGGNENNASGVYASVSGGRENRASAHLASVVAGLRNKAIGEGSAILGGAKNTAYGESSSVNGGNENTASGESSSVNGGNQNTASGRYSAVLGGRANLVETEWGHFP
jgi:hypothetical protein